MQVVKNMKIASVDLFAHSDTLNQTIFFRDIRVFSSVVLMFVLLNQTLFGIPKTQ